jgi:cellulose synthase/poly-beta-1,6-N-acetylglucosamine synthase-like glycosyltransferase
VISVIVPAYNADDMLGDCLIALEAQTLPRDRYEVIVVDDGSRDQTVDVAREYGVRLICQKHAGPAAARNLGAKHAQGDLILFTDADCAPTKMWMERLVAPFDDPSVVGAKGVYRTRQRRLLARFVQLEYEYKYARMARQEVIDFVDTYSAAYRREVFLANGGFRTVFPTPSVEDQELSFRLARKKYQMIFVPQAVVYHRHDKTPREYWQRKFRIGYWKALLLRWHPERAAHDSHTPQTLKLQIGLMGLFLALIPLLPFWSLAWWGAVVAIFIFYLTTIPFYIRIIQQDLPIAMVAPFLFLLRALALGIGLFAGLIRFWGYPDLVDRGLSKFRFKSLRVLIGFPPYDDGGS